MCQKKELLLISEDHMLAATNIQREEERATLRSSMSTKKQQKQQNSKMKLFQMFYSFLLILISAHCSRAFQFPVSGLESWEKNNQARADEPRSFNQVNEAQQLRQLHRVVDTMAELLGEEEQSSAESGRKRHAALTLQKGGPELVDEMEIKQALEELERMQQQQEGQQAVESKSRPVVVAAPEGQQQKQQQQAALESLIDEIGEELGDEQLSQDAVRLLGSDGLRVADRNEVSVAKKDNLPVDQIFENQNVETKTQSSTSRPVSLYQYNNTQIPQSKSPLFVGQLESASSDLAAAQSNDFYGLHAESNGLKADRLTSRDVNALNGRSPVSTDTFADGTRTDETSKFSASAIDLDAAAQTRHPMSRPSLQPAFSQDASTIKFDFSQPAHQANLKLARPGQRDGPSQELTSSNFKQQVGTDFENDQFQTSTLIPIVGPSDNFWRPSGSLQGSDSRDIGQQYERARESQQTFSVLPESRFQSLAPAGQTSAQNSRQAQHVHFTGHSFIPSNGPQFSSSHVSQSNNRDRLSSSTATPLISVLSGSDSSLGNSVSWNPPPTINPPGRQLAPFLHQISSVTTTQAPTEPVSPFLHQTNQGAPSLHLQNTFQNARNLETLPVVPQPPQIYNTREARPGSSLTRTTTEFGNHPETTTFGDEPTVTTSRSIASRSSLAQIERDAAESGMRSPQDSFSSPTTQSSVLNRHNEVAKNQRQSSPTMTSTVPSNVTAKKDDTVIYYYYYYDDNKNATVVAKNVSSANAPKTLDEAIEADGGVEDTPYIEEPVPFLGTRTSTSKPIASTGQAAMSTTQASTSLPITFGTPIYPEDRLRPAKANLGKSQMVVTLPSGSHKSQVGVPDSTSKQNLDQAQIDTRVPIGSINHSTSVQTRPDLSIGTTVPPMPYDVPTTLSKPGSRARTNNDYPSPASTSRRPSTVTEAHALREDKSPFTRNEQGTNKKSPPSGLNAKLQNDLIQGVLKAHKTVGQQQHFTTLPTPLASSSSQSARTPLSNASRYGTNNNLMLDPFSLDPSAPNPMAHLGHSLSSNSTAVHKAWPASNPGHQFVRKPTIPSPTDKSAATHSPRDNSSPSTPASSPIRPSSHFSPQRNTNHAPAVPAETRAQTSNTQSSRTSTMTDATVSSAHRRLKTEEDNSSIDGSEPSPLELTAPPPARSLLRSSTDQTQVVPTQTARNVAMNLSDSEASKLPVISQDNVLREQQKNLDANAMNINNERSAAIDEITRTQPHSATISNQVHQNPRGSNADTRPISLTRADIETTSPQTSSSAASAKTPSLQQVTTIPSVISSAPQFSSLPSTITQNTAAPSTSSSTSSAMVNQSSQSVTTGVSTTTGPQDSSSQPTEDTSSSVTSRKRFGNRNSRFQTRLSSIGSARSLSTTSTTPAPSSTSTTKRPVTSTTRKSSKQLFAGRRRFNSLQAPESSTTSSSQSSISLNNTQGPTEMLSTVSLSPNLTTQASTSGRTRFGNSFTARTRFSPGSSPAPADVSTSTPRPSLFGSAKTPRPRLPFTRPSKGPFAGASTESLDNASASIEPVSSTISSERAATERSTSELSEGTLSGGVSSGTSGDESGEKKDIMDKEAGVGEFATVETVSASTVPTPATSSTATTSANEGRNKPKVRPLFASRHRNTSLFGNRRSPAA